MTISTITDFLEKLAAPALQEDYDNAGLITGDKSWECNGVLVCLDSIEAVIDEAIENKCNLIIAHHPIVFKGLKKINGKNYVERTLIKAIKNDIAIFAIHTNLDNVLTGVNGKMAEKLGLINRTVLLPKQQQLQKLVVYVPVNHQEKILTAMFTAGAGEIGKYSECSFGTEGTGTYKAGENAQPFAGKTGERHLEKEIKVEVIFPVWLRKPVISAMKAAHPYEEVAYDLFNLENEYAETGSGLLGELQNEQEEKAFLEELKKIFSLSLIRYTAFTGRKIRKVALCGGAGSFLTSAAKAAGADVYISADFKYHEFFDADGQILVADIGHYESEQFTIELLFDILSEKFPNFAVLKTGVNTNPVKYLGSAE